MREYRKSRSEYDLLADRTAGRCGSPAPTTTSGVPGLADLVACGAERGDVVRAEVLHLVDEHGDPAAGVRGEPRDVGEQLDEVDLDVPGVGPARDCGRIDPGLPPVPQPGRRRPGRGSRCTRPTAGDVLALRERLEHPEDVVALLAVRRAELADGEVQRGGERTAQRLVGPGLELARPPAPPDGGRPQRVEQHRLADTAQPGEDDAAFRPAAGDPLQDDVERLELDVTPGELRRPLPGARGVGVADGVHPRTVSGCLAATAD